MKVSFRFTNDAMRKLFDKIYKTLIPFVSLLSIKICGITRCTRIGLNTIQVWVVTKPRERQQFSKINRNRYRTQAIQRQTPFCFACKTAFWWLAQPLSFRSPSSHQAQPFIFRWRWLYSLDWFLLRPPSTEEELYKPTHTRTPPYTSSFCSTLLHITSFCSVPVCVCACVCLMYGLLVFVCARDFGFPSSLSPTDVYIKVIKASDLKEAEKRDSPTLL